MQQKIVKLGGMSGRCEEYCSRELAKGTIREAGENLAGRCRWCWALQISRAAERRMTWDQGRREVGLWVGRQRSGPRKRWWGWNHSKDGVDGDEGQIWIRFPCILSKQHTAWQAGRKWGEDAFPRLLSFMLPFPFIGIKVITLQDGDVFFQCLEAAVLSAHKYLWEGTNQRVSKWTFWVSHYSIWA